MRIMTEMTTFNHSNKQDIEKEKIEVDSRKRSAIETVIDVILGFVIFVPVNYLVLPLFVDQIAGYDIVGMLTISAIFTLISLVRRLTGRTTAEPLIAFGLFIALSAFKIETFSVAFNCFFRSHVI